MRTIVFIASTAGLKGYPHLLDPQFTPQPAFAFQDAPNIWAAIPQHEIDINPGMVQNPGY